MPNAESSSGHFVASHLGWVAGSAKENLPLVFVEASSLNQIIVIKKEKSSSR